MVARLEVERRGVALATDLDGVLLREAVGDRLVRDVGERGQEIGQGPTGLRELRRVLRPGGRLAVLEITRPRGLLRLFFRLWFDGIVPLLGKVLPGGEAYTYLPASVRRFPGPEDLAAAIRAAGFEQVAYRRLGGGIIALHSAVVDDGAT